MSLLQGGYMADKMDMAGLVSALERICVEHEAMKTFLSHDYPQWRRDVPHLTRPGTGPHDRTAAVFREVNENLQSGQGDDVLVASLIAALNHVTFLGLD